MTADVFVSIVSVLALGVSIYALVQSRKFNTLDQKFKEFAEGDLKAKQAPRIQVSDELLELRRSKDGFGKGERKRQLKLKYSAVLHNKGTEVAEIKSVTLQVTPMHEEAGEREYGLGALVIGTMYLAPGESISISKEIDCGYLRFVRQFFDMEHCPLLVRCVYRYAGYAGREQILKVGLLKLNKENMIQSHSNWNPPTKNPRSYLLQVHDKE